jgi:Holliday junction resolvase RusA-like endonuclease
MPEITITIPGSIRSKKNSKRIFARGPFKRVLPSKAYEVWEKQAQAEIYGGGLPVHPPLICSVRVEAHFYYKGIRPDLSGCMESIADAMEGILWENDRQIMSWDGSRLHHDKVNPRTDVTVRW